MDMIDSQERKKRRKGEGVYDKGKDGAGEKKQGSAVKDGSKKNGEGAARNKDGEKSGS